MMNVLIALISSSLLLPAMSSAFQTQPRLNVAELDGLNEVSGKGEYDKVLKAMNLNYSLFPAKRAELNMLRENSCMFPLDKKMLVTDKPLIQSAPVQVVHIALFSVAKKYQSLKEMKGRRLGIRSAINFGSKLEKEFSIAIVSPSKSLKQNLEKLQSGRVDAVLEFVEDIEIFKRDNPEFKISFIRSPDLLAFEDAVTCIDSPENRKFISDFNEKLGRIKKPQPTK